MTYEITMYEDGMVAYKEIGSNEGSEKIDWEKFDKEELEENLKCEKTKENILKVAEYITKNSPLQIRERLEKNLVSIKKIAETKDNTFWKRHIGGAAKIALEELAIEAANTAYKNRETSKMTGDQIKKHRMALNLTQKQLADKMGVRVETVSRWERNTRKPQPSAIMLLKIILNPLKAS